MTPTAKPKYYPLWLLLITAIYFSAAKLGLSQAFIHANVSPVWPPTGFAIAVVWWLGYRISPAVFAGAFLVNLATGVSIGTAFGIATGNTLEAVSAVFLLRRYVGLHNPFYRARDVVPFLLITAGISTSLSATIGNVSLCLGGAAAWTDFAALWLTWWLGDSVGALVIAPFLLTWIDRSPTHWTRQQVGEIVAFLLSLLLTSDIVFGGLFVPKLTGYPLEHLMLPFLFWAAFRFGPRGTATTIAIISALAIWGTRRGFGPFAIHSPNESLLLLQVFVAAASITALVLAAIVTERKRIEAALQAKETQLQLITDITPIMLTLCSRELRYRFVNRAYADMFGLTIQQIVGKRIVEIVGQEAYETIQPHIQRVLNGDAVEFEAAVPYKLGGQRFMRAVYMPDFDEAGTVAGWVASLTDITERKENENERDRLLEREQRARAEAEAANRVKDEFLAIVSHELRTPLTSIVGWAHLLRTRRLDATTSECAFEAIQRNASVQAQLVDDLLDVSRIISDKLRLDLKPVELTSVVNAAVDSLRHTFDEKGIQLKLMLESVGHVEGDIIRLQQVMWNLLSNSAKFTPQGGRVEIRLERKGSNAQLTVADNGEGIGEGFLPYIFDRFRQEDTSRSRKHGGLGLGLSIVQHLVQMHGGTVHVYSAGEHQGTTFTITLALLSTVDALAKGQSDSLTPN